MFIVFHRRKDFRLPYSLIGDLRGLLTHAPVLALTATASTDMISSIKKSLLMEDDYILITACLDRPNIKYFCFSKENGVKSLQWLMDGLIKNKKNMPKTIIYCRTINSCSKLYKLFVDTLGCDAFVNDSVTFSNMLIGMFHHSTAKCNKLFIESNFVKYSSTLRVIIATDAFGMGINIPDVRFVVNWGYPRTLSNFVQQCGRAGRDNKSSCSILYRNNKDDTDAILKAFADSNKMECRRRDLLSFFGTCTMQHDHLCCDVCMKMCICDECCTASSALPVEIPTFVLVSNENLSQTEE